MQQSLKSRTISGMLWSFSDLIMNQGLSFIIQIILARLLLPEDFGIIGMITIFIAISTSMIDSGFGNALIREKETTQEDCSTMFFFNLGIAVTLYFLLFAFSPRIADFFHEPRVTLLLRILSLVLIINSLGLIQRVLLAKKIDFKTQTKINLIASVFSGITAILLAFYGFGIWALVIRMLIMQGIQVTLLWIYNHWIPSFIFSMKSFRKLFGFGWKLLISGIIETFYQNLYYLIIGRSFSATDLGYYTNAKKLSDVASQAVASAVQKVSYPVLSRMKEDNEQLKNGYRKIIRSTMFIAFPLMIGAATIAEPMILLLFGEKWSSSILYFQVICFEGMLYPLHAINLNILQVKGRTDLFLRLEVIKKVIFTVIISFALYRGAGIMALLWCNIGSSVIAYFINSYFSATLIAYPTRKQLSDIFPAFCAAVGMGGSVYFLSYFMEYSLLVKFVLEIAFCLISYCLFSKLMRIAELNRLFDLMKLVRNKIGKGMI